MVFRPTLETIQDHPDRRIRRDGRKVLRRQQHIILRVGPTRPLQPFLLELKLERLLSNHVDAPLVFRQGREDGLLEVARRGRAARDDLVERDVGEAKGVELLEVLLARAGRVVGDEGDCVGGGSGVSQVLEGGVGGQAAVRRTGRTLLAARAEEVKRFTNRWRSGRRKTERRNGQTTKPCVSDSC